MAKPCTKMPVSTLRERLQSTRVRLIAALPGDPAKRMLRSWHTRYTRAIETLRAQG